MLGTDHLHIVRQRNCADFGVFGSSDISFSLVTENGWGFCKVTHLIVCGTNEI